MIKQKRLNYCKKCKKNFTGNYCDNCGEIKELKRIDKHYLIDEFRSVLNFEKGFFYTIRELLFRPGTTIRKFIHEDRNRLVKPVIFIILSSLIYTILKESLHLEEGYLNNDDSKRTTAITILEWVQNNYGYSNILMGVFIAFSIKLLFRKYDYNFYETLILLCYVMGIGMLIYSVFGVIEGLTNVKVLKVAGIIAIAYSTWAIGQFFDKRKYINYLKAFLSYFLGMLTFLIGVIVIGLLIDLFI